MVPGNLMYSIEHCLELVVPLLYEGRVMEREKLVAGR